MDLVFRQLSCLLIVLLAAPSGVAQSPLLPGNVSPAGEAVALPAANQPWVGSGAPPTSDLTYRLGAGDVISIAVVEVPELQAREMRIGTDGILALPLAGRVQAAGFTVREFSTHLENKMKDYVREPHVAVNVVEFRSQPVSILGAVNSPGVHQLQGRKSLVEILSLAGGIRQDAGYEVRLTRRMDYGVIPIAGAEADASGQYSTVEIPIEDLTQGLNPGLNIEVMPHDVISVPTGKMVYAIGAIGRAGGFVLSERQEMSVLELLALAGGVQGPASKRNAKILRPQPGSAGREEIEVDLKEVMRNEGGDIPLYAGDILVVPESGSKKLLTTAITAGIGVGTGIALWRLGRGSGGR